MPLIRRVRQTDRIRSIGGMKFAKTADGSYMHVNNSMQEYMNDAHTTSYLSTSKDVSGVEDYYFSATITVKQRSNFGGVGIIIDKDVLENPISLWY